MTYIRHMFVNLILHSAVIIFISVSLLFGLAILIKDNSIIDIFWGIGFLEISLSTFFLSEEITIKKAILLFLVAIWSLRLSIHIFSRNRKKGEDFRYQAWREQWKYFHVRSYLQVFLLQGIIMMIIASPIVLVNSSPSEHIGLFELIGIGLFICGFLIEAIADFQLRLFLQKPENKGILMTSGLWRISRHPNYFGEVLLWFGIWLIAIPEVDGIFTILSPILITFLLRYVSGVPLLEKKYPGRTDWEEYKKRVPPIFPRFFK